MRKRSLPQPEERTERRISAATSLSICALTVIAQIVLTLALTQLLAEKISYVYFILELAGQLRLHGAGAFGCCRSHSGVSALWQPQL